MIPPHPPPTRANPWVRSLLQLIKLARSPSNSWTSLFPLLSWKKLSLFRIRFILMWIRFREYDPDPDPNKFRIRTAKLETVIIWLQLTCDGGVGVMSHLITIDLWWWCGGDVSLSKRVPQFLLNILTQRKSVKNIVGSYMEKVQVAASVPFCGVRRAPP